MNINLGNMAVSGQARFIVRGKNGKIKQDTPYQDNLLLDKFFTLGFAPSFLYAYVGTSSDTPIGSQTHVLNQLGVVSGSGKTDGAGFEILAGGSDADGYTALLQEQHFSWELGDIIGNISEYCISVSQTANNAIVRNLIKDSSGNPTTITLTADDQLEIYWRLSKKSPGSVSMSSAVTSVLLNGVSTDVTATQLNPNIFSTYQAWSKGIEPKLLNSLYINRSVNISNTDSLALYNAVAGESILTGFTSVESILGTARTPTMTVGFPIAGTIKYTFSYNHPLTTTNSVTETTKMVVFILGNNNSIKNSEVFLRLKFNPEFIIGTDKLFAVSISYTVSRVQAVKR